VYKVLLNPPYRFFELELMGDYKGTQHHHWLVKSQSQVTIAKSMTFLLGPQPSSV